jgi:DNA-binding GntR family transcriptional regulator
MRRIERGGSVAAELKLTTGPSLADQAYRVLREMITGGALTAGERVTERGLAARLGVSPTPVREAIARLEHERLLQRPDGRALVVTAPSLDWLREVALIQAALRGVAAGLAATNASDEELARVAAAHDRAQRVGLEGRTVDEIAREVLAETQSFHHLIDQAAHNPMLADMIATATAFDLAIRLRAANTLGADYPAHEGHEDHAAILRALLDRDAARAETLTRQHLGHTATRFLAFLEQERSNTTDSPAAGS